ncbi:hypothetical protein H1R20_g413, partial [Candolleomyces eurysporus]
MIHSRGSVDVKRKRDNVKKYGAVNLKKKGQEGDKRKRDVDRRKQDVDKRKKDVDRRKQDVDRRKQDVDKRKKDVDKKRKSAGGKRKKGVDRKRKSAGGKRKRDAKSKSAWNVKERNKKPKDSRPLRGAGERERNERPGRDERWKKFGAGKSKNVRLKPTGLEVKRVIPGFDLCTITIKELPTDATRVEITNIFREQGMDDTMFQLVSCRAEGNSQVAKFLLRAEEARVMAIGLEDLEFRDNLIKFEVGDNASWGSMTASSQSTDQSKTLTAIWSIPSAAMVATYSTVNEAKLKAKALSGRIIDGRKISATMNTRPNGPAARYWVEASIKLTNLDPATEPYEISAIAGTHLVRAIKSNTYDLEWFLSWLKQTLEREGCIRGSYQTTEIGGNRMKAVAKFNAHDALQRAAAILERGAHIGLTRQGPTPQVIVPTEHNYTISIPKLQYQAQKAQWDAMTEGRRGKKAFVRISEKKNGQVVIFVQGSDQQEIGPLKVRVEGLVAGERLDAEHWHNSFSQSERALRQKVSAGSNEVFLSVDRRLHALRVFGGSNDVAAAKLRIREEVQRLALMEYEIPIARQSVRFFVATGLQILKDALGEDNVTLDVASRACTLKLKGGDDAIQHARKLVEEAIAAASDGILPSAEDNEDGAVCPICYDTASHPELLSCGHSYCEPCLRHYLTSAATSNKFPLVCMGDEASCNKPISIPIIQRYLTKQRFNHLIDVVFSSYIQSNPQKFKYCTTPDCTQIYQCDTGNQFHKCPSCFSEICSSCNEEAHEGMTCEERRIQSNPAEQERLTEEWAQSNNIKRCPSCNVLTEKTEGCNHMACRCGAHFCWICRGVFAQGTIYEHMNTAHGGFYGAAVANQNPVPPVQHQQERIRIWQDHLNAEREIEAARRRAEALRQGEVERAAAEAARRRRIAEQEEEYRRIAAQRERQNRHWEEYAREQQRRREREAQLAAEVARREAEKKNEGSFCAIM